ncbi:HpsJ family protein [Acaryochloris sp. IP29b_bin.137]|uniref:HpsJ-like protein, cyanoexosortase A-associated n=1 Tax=Acaryochloris sp. IP29b_bin.137 TaxID=2969217 RepID=UPI0026099068|nr:HpsJ family protein [Acaryochloris sp. IP29b_bin.137]
MENKPSAASPSKSQWLSTFVLRLTGYALLLLTLVDTLATILPPQLLDPAWELETIGRLVERSPVPLIGFALVASGGRRFRQSLDRLCFKAVPALAIIIGLAYCLMIPLGISDSLRLSNQHQTASETLIQQAADIQKLEQRLSEAPASDVAEWAQKFQPNLAEGQNQAEIKAGVLAQLKANQASLNAQISRASQQPAQLQKRTIKWLVGALVAGLSFLYIGNTVRQFPPVRMK